MYEYDWAEEFPDIPLDVLTKNQRDVIYLRYVVCLKFVEIAEEVGRPKESVVRTHRQALIRTEKFLSSMKLLKRCFLEDNNEPPDVIE